MNALSSVRIPSHDTLLVVSTSTFNAHGFQFCGYAFERYGRDGVLIESGDSFSQILEGDHTKAVVPAIIHGVCLVHEPSKIGIVIKLEYLVPELNKKAYGPANTNYKKRKGGSLADSNSLKILDVSLEQSNHRLTARMPDDSKRERDILRRLTDRAHECAKAGAKFRGLTG